MVAEPREAILSVTSAERDPTDRGVEVAGGPRLDRARDGQAADQQRHNLREGNPQRSGRSAESVAKAVGDLIRLKVPQPAGLNATPLTGPA
ncbi:MAG TPA: hypothetical protein VN327_00430 [Pseudonocardiaceae bacterium]|jgi:hypothetical protein|nr:hypothetical protein [Pseudonocardiaceae bacterium]